MYIHIYIYAYFLILLVKLQVTSVLFYLNNFIIQVPNLNGNLYKLIKYLIYINCICYYYTVYFLFFSFLQYLLHLFDTDFYVNTHIFIKYWIFFIASKINN